MTEKLSMPTPEKQPAGEHLAIKENQSETLRKPEQENNIEAKVITTEQLEEIRHHIEDEALPAESVATLKIEKSSSAVTPGMQQELKNIAYKQTLQRVRSRLRNSDRLLSTVIHQPTIEAVSEAAGKTAARPSGLLGGSLCALIGSCYLVYVTNHYGFSYNYLLFFAFFIGGFIVGIGLEIIIRLILRVRD